MSAPPPERHFVATGYVVRDGKTLLIRHKKLKMWLPPGGHIDENELPEDAALREILEETGLKAEIVSPRRTDACERGVTHLHVPSHVQLEDIPNHPQHIDLIYFCRATGDQAPVISERETDGARWFSIQDLRAAEVREEVRQTGERAIRWVQQAAARPG